MITRKTIAQSRLAQRKKGFTLTEIAIVLGIMGLILGAIWVAASSVYANQKAGKASTEILAVTQGIRTLYSTSATMVDVAGINETTPMINAGIFPADMVSGGVVYTAWGSSTSAMVTSQTVTTAGDAFGIEFNKIPPAGCINLLTSLTGSGRDSGLYYANATAAAIGAAAFAGAFPPPITAVAANAACESNGGGVVSVQFAFKLKG